MMVYSYFMYNIYTYFINRDCILSDNSFEIYQRIDEIHLFLYRLTIYYTLIIIFMIPSLLFIYYLLFFLYKLCLWIYDKFEIFCIRYNNNRVNNNNNNNNNNSNYLDKSERYNLVEKSMSDCPICLNENVELILTKGCKHGCCSECLYKYLKTDLKNIGSYPRKCFMNECDILLNYTNVEYVLIKNIELEEYDRMLILSSTNGENETISCPLCNAVMLKPKDISQQGLMQCINENCKCDLCSRCGVLYHLNQTCQEYQLEIQSKTSGADQEFDKLTKLNKWCKCPNCGLVVERTEGCYHMTHYGCPGGGVQKRTDFCYLCGELLMKKNGEGWRYSKNTQLKHFENGVYEQCINAHDNNDDNNNHNINIDIDINHGNEIEDDAFI